MKRSIIIFFALMVLVFCKSTLRNNRPRALTTEDVALELDYLGTCKQFNEKDLNSVRISTHNAGGCLPLIPGGNAIQYNGQFNDPDAIYPDLNDLHSDFFCTDVEGPRALIHFVEIYDSLNTKATNFILSFVPSAPFKARNNDIIYTRRPTCETDRSFCDNVVEKVTNCTPNVIQLGAIMQKGQNFINNAYVIQKDRIYLTTSANVPSLCDDGISCCSYVSPRSDGYCPYQTGDFILSFLEDYELHTSFSTHHKHKPIKYNHKNPHIKPVYAHKKSETTMLHHGPKTN
eukprot:TRINITY_DN12227_c1_g1_i1.p1 TRINITY_DN12227_c1_g1~~TRINITY_DN12227_c1_g1_i1.p1  ORF type:complete len:288 (-),score=58.54 TRINITY_DN12227_c1_g1_i1:69-932(-)